MKKNIFTILLLFNCIWSQNATVEKILFIGSSLKDHWFENNELKSRTLISNSAFNRVVIQDYSNNPLQNSKESQKYFIKFIDHIKLNNGTPYIFTTWMYKGITSNNYDVLDPMYHALKPLADKTGAI